MTFVLSSLYPILDAAWMPAEEKARAEWLMQTVNELHDAGVTLVQLREKGAAPERLRRDAEMLRQGAPPGLRLILNDDPLMARAIGFDGVHVGQGDTPVAEARAILGADAIVGVSTHSAAELGAAAGEDATYVAIGPVFATASKRDASPMVGLEGVRGARALTAKPLVAIGGITPLHAAAVRAAGADAIAVIGALFGDALRGPGELARDFLRALG